MTKRKGFVVIMEIYHADYYSLAHPGRMLFYPEDPIVVRGVPMPYQGGKS